MLGSDLLSGFVRDSLVSTLRDWPRNLSHSSLNGLVSVPAWTEICHTLQSVIDYNLLGGVVNLSLGDSTVSALEGLA